MTESELGFDELPAWAELFNFLSHSASGSARPDCRQLWEMRARKLGLYTPPGCRMIGGLVAEHYGKDIVIRGTDPSTAFRAAVAEFDEHRIVEHDPTDAARFATIRDEEYSIPATDPAITGTVLELTCKHTAQGLAEATRTSNRVDDGPWISVQLPGVELPFIGQLDVLAGGVVEIKTKWPTLSERAKRGWLVNSLPARPDPNHVGQVALYWRWLREQSDNVPVKLVYANCKGYRVFDSGDCEELSVPNLEAALDRMRIVARARESLMKQAGSVEQLFSMIAPDFQHFMWRDVSPEYMAAARKQWGI